MSKLCQHVFFTVLRHLPVMSPFVWRGGRHRTRILVTSSSDCVTVTSRGAVLGAAMHIQHHAYSALNINI